MNILDIVQLILALMTLVGIFCKPLREKLFNNKKTLEGERCLLRSQMLGTYYRNKDSGQIHQYELENFLKLYDAYKALGGNSFIDDVYKEVTKWEMIR